MGGFFLFNNFIEGLTVEFPNFLGKKTGGKQTKVSFKAYIVEANEFYTSYKEALQDNIYSFAEIINVKRQLNDNNNV